LAWSIRRFYLLVRYLSHVQPTCSQPKITLVVLPPDWFGAIGSHFGLKTIIYFRLPHFFVPLKFSKSAFRFGPFNLRLEDRAGSGRTFINRGIATPKDVDCFLNPP
jgi:hypothetical protein